MQLQKILEEFVERCKEKLGSNLVAIALFGSFARGTAKEFSDIDLLVVTDGLPKDWRIRDEIVLEIEGGIGFKYGTHLSILLVAPKELEEAVAAGAPLVFGIMKGYKTLFEKDDFFKNLVLKLAENMRRWKVVEIKPFVWKVAE